MILYLLKSAACLLILLLVHQFLLQRESMHRFNRFFLLFSVVVSFLIPLYVIEIAAVPVQVESGKFEILENVGQSEYSEIGANSESIPTVIDLEFQEEASIPWKAISWSLYLGITLIFLIRFIRNIHILADKISQNLHVSYRGETLVLMAENSLPFTFLKYIFVSKTYFEEGKLTESIFAHERAHLREKHSLDLLFIELLLVFFWFHPALYLARQAIKLNHEFIADQAALQATTPEKYQKQLLSMMVYGQNLKLASSLNFSLTKKRFEMMRRKTANSTKWIKILSVIPVLAALVYFFSEKVTAQAEADKKSEVVVNKVTASKENEIQILLRADGKIKFDGQIIEVAQLAGLIDSNNTVNTLARISADPEVAMGFVADVQELLREKDVRRVVYEGQSQQKQEVPWQEEHEAHFRNAYILVEDENMEYTHKTYYQLTEKEKEGLFGPMRPSGKTHPDPTLFESWKDEETYALWIDGEVSANKKLEDFEASDFVFFYQSSVKSNARSERFPQPFQVHLYSDSYYDLLFGPNSEGRRPRTNRDTITLTQRMVTWNHDISRNPDTNTAYLQKNARYEKMRKSGKAFNQKPQQEQEDLNSLYQQLNEEYLKSSEKRKKSLKQPISPQTENQKPVSASLESNPASLSTFKELNGLYQVKLNQNGPFAKKSDIEIKRLFDMFTSLHENYIGLSYEDKRIIQRPTFPFARLEQDGKVIFKRFEDLTDAERKAQAC